MSLNHVGIALGLELSRLSRSNTEWHHLIDVCGIFHSAFATKMASTMPWTVTIASSSA